VDKESLRDFILDSGHAKKIVRTPHHLTCSPDSARRDAITPPRQRAEQSLHTAKSELEKAGTEWGGHRVAAIKHIDAALQELEKAQDWAGQHHEIK